MNKEIKAKWIKALRSRKFKQADGVLHNDEGYCCLGVLAEVVNGPEIWNNRKEIQPSYDDEYLIEEFLEEVGLSDETQKELANMNDGTFSVPKHSFKEIADFIEQKL